MSHSPEPFVIAVRLCFAGGTAIVGLTFGWNCLARSTKELGANLALTVLCLGLAGYMAWLAFQ